MNNFLLKVFLFLLIPCLHSCSGKPKTKILPGDTTVQRDSGRGKPPSSFSDSLVIDFPAAVFYSPDSLQLEKIKRLLPPGDYESSVHECFFQMKNARTSLKENWPRVRVIDVSNIRYLLFVKADNSKTCIDLDTKKDMCGLFLFNRVKDPLQADMMNIGTALDYYFKKQ